MKKIEKLLTVILFICLSVACSDDDDKRDNTSLDMPTLTGKNWYYNAWLGLDNKDSFDSDDLLEVIRFEQGGQLKHIDFGGRQESVVGRWESSDETNLITLKYEPGEKVTWHVKKSGDNYIQAIINEQGTREYWSELDYLDDLTADAFLVNEYTEGNKFRTYIGADVRGNRDISEGEILRTDGSSIKLENHSFYWTEEKAVGIEHDGKEIDLRFYLRIGGNHLKLKDRIYSSNLPDRLPSDLALDVEEKNGGIQVSWLPYSMDGVYYKVEILSEDMNLKDPYFVSIIQNVGSEDLNIKSTTAAEITRMDDLKLGNTYVVRLTALLYEPGVDAINDGYGFANVQALAYFSKKFLKE